MTEMKTLGFPGGKTYEIVDAKARETAAALETRLTKQLAKQERELRLLRLAADGVLLTEETNSEEAYTKQLPTDVLDACLESFGGKSESVDGAIVSADVTGVEIVGRNVCGEIVSGGISTEGADTADTGRSRTDYIPTYLFPSGQYYVSASLGSGTPALITAEYDEAKGLVYREANVSPGLRRTLHGGKYLRIAFYGSSGVTPESLKNVFICDYQNKDAFSAYRPPVIHASPDVIRSLPGYGWSAGSVYNEVDWKNRRYIQRVGALDLGTQNWTMVKENGFSCVVPNKKVPSRNVLCSRYAAYDTNFTWANIGNYPDRIISTNDLERYLFIKDTAVASAAALKEGLSGVMVYYELEEPVITELPAEIEAAFWLGTEPGGSVTFRQSGAELAIPNTETFIVKTGGSV